MYEYLITCLRKKHIWTRMFGIFHFHYILFENINQEHNLLPDCACLCVLNCLLMYFLRNVCQAFLLSILKLLSLVIFPFRLMPNGNCLLSSASLLLVADNSLVHELRVVAAVELHLNATYYAQHPALKAVYEKS